MNQNNNKGHYGYQPGEHRGYQPKGLNEGYTPQKPHNGYQPTKAVPMSLPNQGSSVIPAKKSSK